ncbi:PTS system mannose/fructose/N-acetylgalactosamine-transporter subunit IIB [Faecalitalea cylindroides]|uniref:Putative sorbose-specific phosphotransferase enzyme IIB component n=1 Tax=Faecalitalea cylindroides ATCC 27803 TaxID=649755 RepID=U2QNX6_9FIRM|nr:PTS sugar transporter subunit IIB [Faecalitalea cylindroides]ERK42998.1 putative sorbose-specific phosphotransferase enzyme IIB component [[Eubacterium] cylindroides ATCC 27803] [Faecalitalea cylindroides ATCC 27803]OUN60078.1 PTS mannose/fructose/sorbose transporter subunit IIB [Faecalitalea cylindroides]
MAIELVRIDDRLIHGQIATTWINDFNIEQVLIINDDVVKDSMQQSVIAMTAPANVKVKVFGVDSFVNIYKKNPIKRRTMIILTNSIDAYKLAKGGVKFPYLNVGGMRFVNGRTKIARAVSVTPEERQAFKDILKLGINIKIQMIPRDEVVNMEDVIDKNMEGEE